jgi:hypothetical protein
MMKKAGIGSVILFLIAVAILIAVLLYFKK